MSNSIIFKKTNIYIICFILEVDMNPDKLPDGNLTNFN